MAANKDEISIRPMTLADIPFGLRLSTAAGWNQTAADWRLILSQKNAAGFLACLSGVSAGTVTVIPYQTHFSWVGMALVSAEFQRRGLGTILLTAAIEAGMAAGLVRLDATPAGKKLYDQLGFRDEYPLTRMRRSKPSALPAQGSPLSLSPQTACFPIIPDLFPCIHRFDRPVFGASRLPILKGLYQMAPQLAFAWVESNIIKGYCLGRVGARYAHIGPIVAEDIQVARGLLLKALTQCANQEVILDAPHHDRQWLEFLSSLGFSELRPFIRMCCGSQEPPRQSSQQFAIAGPELG
jgi:GNAT superfamily N-acetyltransferase